MDRNTYNAPVTVEIDLEQRRIVAGVRDLCGDDGQRAIGLSGTGLSRMWLGQELHRRVQVELATGDANFQAEVHAQTELEIEGWTLAISGRADGVAYQDGVPVRIDEIKTLHFAVDLRNLYHKERMERFRRQAALYAFMLSPHHQPVSARLILVDIVSTAMEDEEVEWDPESVLAWLTQTVHRLVSAERRRLERLRRLREAAELLRFPHDEPRPVQERIADAVAESLEQGRHLLLRAPTGCGKTAAVLHPALRVALSRGQRLFFLTAKTLQQKIAVDTARAMQDGLFRSLQLRAKGKMCANAEIICHEEFCPYAREYGIKLIRTQLLKRLLDSDHHQDPDDVFHAAREHEVCPFEVSLDLLPDVDLVVCDYNYVFDPNIGLGALLHGGALRDAVLVIDEAHNLVDRSREYYSPELDTELLERARSFLQTRDNTVYRQLRTLVGDLALEVVEVVSEALPAGETGERIVEFDRERLSGQRIEWDGAMLSYFMYKRENDLWVADDPVMDVFLAFTRFHRVLMFGGDEFVHLATRGRGGLERIKIFCLDASRFLGQLLDESAGAVAMSATLEPFDFYRDLLGFDQHRTDELRVRSPFPAENRLVLAIEDVDTTYRNRNRHFDRIAAWIGRLAAPRHNVLTLFPSYEFLSAVADRLPPTTHSLLLQEPGSSDATQREFLEALSNGDPHLVLAVLGGIFAEGVDYPGDMLSQVIVVSPGLPQFNTERELLKAYYQEFYGHGFGYAYLVPGLTRVVQAAGRIFRSDDDRGVIVLMCRRFQDPRYARLLPEEWTDEDPTTMLREDPEHAVRDFFGEW
jgi:DNA excision repair protein ERCC-2